MKSKKLVLLVVILGAIIGLFLVARVTGMLQLFRTPTSANSPAIKTGEHLWVSNIPTPKRFDFIVFMYNDSLYGGKQHRVYRLCGIPGDTVEIRNGDLYVNGQNTNNLFDLSLPYITSGTDGIKANELLKLEEENFFVFDNGSKAELYLDKQQIEQIKPLNISLERKIIPNKETDEYISKVYGHPWNIDHFGPLAIPKDRYFVLGDNRHHAQDSRYTGLVPISDFYGTVISK